MNIWAFRSSIRSVCRNAKIDWDTLKREYRRPRITESIASKYFIMRHSNEISKQHFNEMSEIERQELRKEFKDFLWRIF